MHTSNPQVPLVRMHKYACLRCRTRKTKCDKRIPVCVPCIEAGTQCIYSARKPRKSQRTTKPTLISKTLLPAEDRLPPPSEEARSSDDEGEEDMIIPSELRDSSFEVRVEPVATGGGRLLVSQGRSRYINGDKADQVANLASILAAGKCNKHREGRPPLLSPPAPGVRTKPSSLLGPSRIDPSVSLRLSHPAPETMTVLWGFYTRNIDVFIKIVYKPDVEKIVMRACAALEEVSPEEQTLLFGIWFAAIVSMSAEDCSRALHEEKGVLVRRYRDALEESLAQVGWMTTQEITVLQALVLLLVCAPKKNARSTWISSGVALSVAQAMGLHFDGASFGFNVVQTEVRRRVWWSLCQLDNRISEDCGLEPHVPFNTDTKLPLQINDSDIDPGSSEPPVARNEFTEMTGSLLKYHKTQLRQKIKRSRMSPSEIETLVREKKSFFEAYLPIFDTSDPIQRLCYFGTRLIITELWKMAYDASRGSGKDAAELKDMKELLLFHNAEVLEITHQLQLLSGNEFGRFFQCKYTRWHAMAYLLLELCKTTTGPAVDRAWAVLDKVFECINKGSENGRSNSGAAPQMPKKVLHGSLLTLLEKAREAHRKATQAVNTGPVAGDENRVLHDFSHWDGSLSAPGPCVSLDSFEQTGLEQMMETWSQNLPAELLDLSEPLNLDFSLENDSPGELGWW